MSETGHSGSCRDMVEYLSDYIDGELDGSLQDLIDRHRGDCPPCEAFIRTLTRTVEAVRSQPSEPLSEELKRALSRAIRGACD